MCLCLCLDLDDNMLGVNLSVFRLGWQLVWVIMCLCLDLDDNLLGVNLSLFRPGWQHVGWQPERGKIRRPDHSPEPQPQTQRHQETAAGLENQLFSCLLFIDHIYFPVCTLFLLPPAFRSIRPGLQQTSVGGSWLSAVPAVSHRQCHA